DLAEGDSREVTFTYTATDNNDGVSAPATVTLTVTGTNDVPVATDSTGSTSENAVFNGKLPPASDVDGTIASYQLASGTGVGNGSVTVNAGGGYTFNPGTDFDDLAEGD
ncbi:hypothetical protein FK516_29770, partial [Klebsiella pneumoniae]|nr:hypothetical protein [Klebsiella pneumoniae]